MLVGDQTSMNDLADMVEMATRASQRVAWMHGLPKPRNSPMNTVLYSRPWSARRTGIEFAVALRDWPHTVMTPVRPEAQRLSKDLDEVTAALWRLCIDLPETCTATCPACPPTEGPILFETRGDAKTWLRKNTLSPEFERLIDIIYIVGEGTGFALWCSRSERWATWADVEREPCETCNDTREVPRSWGDVLLASIPRPPGELFASDGRVEDREAIAVLADELQASGDALGEWLALWRDRTRCTACRGSGSARSLLSVSHSRDSWVRMIDIEFHGAASGSMVLAGDVRNLAMNTSRSPLFKCEGRTWQADEIQIRHHDSPYDGSVARMRMQPIVSMRGREVTLADNLPVDINFDCDRCCRTGLEAWAHSEAIAARLEPLTWIRDRMPEVGDEIEMQFEMLGEVDGLIDVTGTETLLGRVIDLAPKVAIRISNTRGTAIRDPGMIEAWRYRVDSIGAQAPADHRADPRPTAPRDPGRLP